MIAARFEITGASAIDLFAGAGSLGLEAISRGADHCTFVDHSRKNIEVLKRNAESLGVTSKCEFVSQDVLNYLTAKTFESCLVLADPPYDYPALDEIVQAVADSVQAGLFVLEHDSKWDFSRFDELVITKKYGRTHISLFSYPVGETK